MKIVDFIENTNLQEKNEVERAKLICFYQLKENDVKQFTMSRISDFMVESGFNEPNTSRLKEKLIKNIPIRRTIESMDIRASL